MLYESVSLGDLTVDRSGGFPKKRTLNKRTRGLFLLDRRELVGSRMEFWKGGTSRTDTEAVWLPSGCEKRGQWRG